MTYCQIGGSELDKAPRSPFSIPSHEDEFISRLLAQFEHFITGLAEINSDSIKTRFEV